MIVTRLCGGLGNQLFQYAAGRRLAHARQTELVLDLAWYEHTPASNTRRGYELSRYPIQARATVGAEVLWCRLHSGRLLRRLALPRRWTSFRERRFDFDGALLELPDNIYLDGYWQSHCYFEDIAEVIRAETTPSPPAGPRDLAVAAAIQATQAVSVHVRRGDYVTQRAAATVHGACPPGYYVAAFETLGSLVPNPHFFVFSDDSEWTRRNLVLPGRSTFVDHNGPETAFQDLHLMSLCRHHVIANSSFSWWGAWLARSSDKVVIAPRHWFADQRPTPTLTPSAWIRL